MFLDYFDFSQANVDSQVYFIPFLEYFSYYSMSFNFWEVFT
jgi:hypothetical protein